MKLGSALLALWLGLWPLPPAFAAGPADAMLAQAGAALASGQYDAATMLATGGLEQAGLDDLVRCRLLVIRGLSGQAQGRGDGALLDFTRALHGGALQGEERARAQFARGLSLDAAGRLKEALGDYSAALAIAPGATYALNNRANVYRRQGLFEEARRDYTAALAANTPNPQYPYYGLGQIAEAQGDRQGAWNFYSRAVIADPNFALARERLEAMGPPAEGPAGVPADPGIIVLRPPPARDREVAVVLQPPRTQEAAVMAPPPRRSPIQPVVAPPVPPPPGKGAPLRPAIVDGARGAPAKSGVSPQTSAQLGAWRSEAEARDGWAVAQRMAGHVLEGASPLIVRAELPRRGVYYRLRIAVNGPVSQFCAVLMQKGLACIPARN